MCLRLNHIQYCTVFSDGYGVVEHKSNNSSRIMVDKEFEELNRIRRICMGLDGFDKRRTIGCHGNSPALEGYGTAAGTVWFILIQL